MATIFYNVQENLADSFKTNKAGEKVVGFVNPENTGDFGYLVAGGKQYGASKTEIVNIIKTEAPMPTVNASKNSLEGNGGAKYTFTFTNGELSVSKYIATTVSARTSQVTTQGSKSGGGAVFLGSTYTMSASISKIPNTAQNDEIIKYTINNPTGNEWAVCGIKTGSTYVFGGEYTSSTKLSYQTATSYNGDFSIPKTAYLASSQTVSESNAYIQWTGSKTITATVPSKTFTVYVVEKGKTPVSCNVTLSATVDSYSNTVSCSAYWYSATTTITSSTKATTSGVTRNNVAYPNKPTTVSFAAGVTPSIAYPSVWGNNLKIKFLGNDTVAAAWTKPTSTTNIEGVECYVYAKKGPVNDATNYTLEF